MSYAKRVQEMYKPKIDQKKVGQLEALKQKTDNANKRRLEPLAQPINYLEHTALHKRVKSPIQIEKSQGTPTQSKVSQPNYILELRQQRALKV